MNSPFRFLVFVVAACLVSCGSPQVATDESPKPNILFIFADDQRADALGCSGNEHIKTPNIDQLAKEGIRFTNSYVMGGHHGAVCAPSRAMLMSGKSLFHVYDKLDGVYTMPMHFAAAGYRTFGTGKWHNGAASFEASFQEGKNVFIGGMSDHFKVPSRNLVDGKLTDPEDKSYSTDLFADAAESFIKEYAGGFKESPFFCYLALTAPHDPRSPREDYIGMYNPDSLPLPGNFRPYHPFIFENFGIRDETLAPWPRTPEDIRASLADYYALISHLDKRIGELIRLLKDKGLYDNTIIVYAADNGLAIGSHGLLGKQNLYEHSTKVPLIMRGPSLPKDQTSDALVYLYDIFPTLSNLCGLPSPEAIDGTDLMPVIAGQSAGRESLFTAYRNTVRAVRTDDWKLIRYPQRDMSQLFNLKQDPLELNNLATDEKNQGKLDEMMGKLSEWQKVTGDTAALVSDKVLPLEYDPAELERKRKADVHQPDYILERFFKTE